MSKLATKVTKLKVINKKGEIEFSTEFPSITAQRAMDIMAHWASEDEKWVMLFMRDRELFDIEGETLILKPKTIWQQMSTVMEDHKK